MSSEGFFELLRKLEKMGFSIRSLLTSYKVFLMSSTVKVLSPSITLVLISRSSISSSLLGEGIEFPELSLYWAWTSAMAAKNASFFIQLFLILIRKMIFYLKQQNLTRVKINLKDFYNNFNLKRTIKYVRHKEKLSFKMEFW